MKDVTHIGMDVHKESIAVAVLRPDHPEPDEFVTPNTPESIRKMVAKIGDVNRLLVCYEAGPTGFDTYRILKSLGVDCDVIAPALIPRRPGVRVKTDRIDARNLARLNRAGELTTVRVPTVQEEALRDFIRTREDLKADLRRVRQRTRGFLSRQGRHYRARTARWGKLFTAWVRSQHGCDRSVSRIHCCNEPSITCWRSSILAHCISNRSIVK